MDGGIRDHPARLGHARLGHARLADIAAASGVAISTVSRALANPGRVNAATRERIQRIADELGYAPNAAGRALASGRTGSIAVVVSDVTNPFYFDLIRSTQQALKGSGHLQLLIDSEDSERREDEVLRRLRPSFDGVILASSRLSDRELIELARELPLVAINRQTRGVPSVFIDTPSGIARAVEHLVSLGHRSIAYAAGPERSWPNVGRWRAFARAVAAAGLEPRRIATGSARRSGGAVAADELLASGATACVAFNDLLAIGMLRRLAERGARVPEDLSLIGCDDIFGADFCSPPLTTIAAPIGDAGRLAVGMLLERIAGPTGPGTRAAVLPAQLVVRASTSTPPADATSSNKSSRTSSRKETA